MLIPVRELVGHGVNPTGVLHLGAHLAEEASAYHSAGWGHVWWVEANPDKIGPLMAQATLTRRRAESSTVIHALVGEREGTSAVLHVASNGESSSVLTFGTHAVEHPEVTMTGDEYEMPVRTVDLLAEEYGIEADLMNLDLQGYELAALKGAVRFLSGVRWVYAEVNDAELYVGCAQVADIDGYLADHGFERQITRWTRHGWGDALYVRTH